MFIVVIGIDVRALLDAGMVGVHDGEVVSIRI